MYFYIINLYYILYVTRYVFKAKGVVAYRMYCMKIILF